MLTDTRVARCVHPITRSGEGEALDGLAGHLGNELKVLVDVQDGQAGEFSGGCDEQAANVDLAAGQIARTR